VDLVLIGCFFCAGIIDSVSFNVYACFVSMQTGTFHDTSSTSVPLRPEASLMPSPLTDGNITGNTVFLGLGVSGQPSNSPTFAWTKSLTAILSFCLGALFFATFHRLLSPLKRWVLLSSFALQTALIVVFASLITAGVLSDSTKSFTQKEAESQKVDGSDGAAAAQFPWLDLLPISLLAFQTAGQVVASRVLKFNALPTVVLTSLYCDLMSDVHSLMAGLFEDPQRNRRAAAAVMLFLGAMLGGFLAKSWMGYAGALWIAAGVKGMMVLAWLLWKRKDNVSETREWVGKRLS
jgi:uncharacterized membrane protein YoaK (UPF0700 family)